MASSEQLEGLVADPNGDVSFLIGTGKEAKTLRISSKVLSLASPVFAALFSPKFSEGRALSVTTSIYQIELPEDDPDALALVCHALHHQRGTPHDINFEELEKVAAVCDKYDLAEVLTPWSGLWIQQWQSNGSGEGHWSKMLCISSIFANNQAFLFSSEKLLASCFTKQSILRESQTFKKVRLHVSIPDEMSSIKATRIFSIAGIPERLFLAICQKREALKRGLQRVIEDLVTPEIEDGKGPKEAYHFMVGLWRSDLWPLSKSLQTSNLNQILQNIRRFKECNGTDGCCCEDLDFGIRLQDAAEFVEKELKGLCLTCVRTGKLTKEDGNCLQPLQSFCPSWLLP